MVSDGAVIHHAVEISRHGPDATAQPVRINFLIDGAVIIRIEFAHQIAIRHIDVAVLARADRQLPGVVLRILQIRQQNNTWQQVLFCASCKSGSSISPPDPRSSSESDSESVLNMVK